MIRATTVCLAICMSMSAMAETLTGQLIGATDGDTITVLVA